MKKILFLILISLHAFSQVYEVDTTFKFEVVKKREPVPYASISQLPNGLLYLNKVGNVINGNLSDTKSYLLDKDGRLVSKSISKIDIYPVGDIITMDNKFFKIDNSKYQASKLQKYLPTGELDSTFNFPTSKYYLHKTYLLPNNNFMTLSFDSESGSRQYLIYNANGKFIKAFNLAQLGFSEDKFKINGLVFNGQDDYFLLIDDEEGNSVILKTNQNFEIDKSFLKIQYSKKDLVGFKIKIMISNNELILFRPDFYRKKEIIEKYNHDGRRIQLTEFDFITEYFSTVSPIIYVQNDKSIDLFFGDDHLKILPDGRLDPVFYKNDKQKNISFLHAFADGTYWVMQNQSGIIEKMNADGGIDANFKINLQNEVKFYPYEIKKLTNNNYLVLFEQIPSRGPYSFRYSPFFNLIRLYNSKHQFVQEISDTRSKWSAQSNGKYFFIRGGGKFIEIDSSLKMTTKIDSFGTDPVTKNLINSSLDLNNDFVYKIERVRNTNESSITRYRISTGQYDMLNIKAKDIYGATTLSDGRIAVYGFVDTNLEVNTFYDIYNSNGKKDETVKRIIISNQLRLDGSLSIEYKRGFIITLTKSGGISGDWNTFYRFNDDGSPDEKYLSNYVLGSQFVNYQLDGTIYTNSGTSKQGGYNNFNKILPNGKMDNAFAVNCEDGISDFFFKDDSTLYAVCDNTLKRLIRNPSPNASFFKLQALPKEITWDYTGILKVNYRTNYKNLKLVLTGDAILKDSVITLTSKRASIIKLQFFDEFSNLIATHDIVVKKVTPSFIYDLPRLTKAKLPFIFTAQSSSKLPVKIKASNLPISEKLVIYPETKRYFELNLMSEGNEQYERIESTILVQVIQESLVNEPQESLVYYPNPVKETLIVDSNILKIDDFKLISMDGREIPISVSGFVGRYEISLRKIGRAHV